MPAQSGVAYVRLFDVRVLHHYWLDRGSTVFDPDAADGRQRLLEYDVRRVLAILPTAATATLIAGLRGIFRATRTGFVVAVPDRTVLAPDSVPADTTLDVALCVVPTSLATYAAATALTLRPQRLVTVEEPGTDPTSLADRILHRYKSDVPVLSNLTGTSRTVNGQQRLYLSREYPDQAGGDGVEALVTSGADLSQLTGDPPAAPLGVLGPRNALPVYVHQGDVPTITPPPGTTGAPTRGVELAPGTPPELVALVRLGLRRPDDQAFSVVDQAGRPLQPRRVFEVHLRNRWTTWRYRDRRDGSITSVEPAPLPLTHLGNAGSKQKAPASGVGVVRDPGDPPRITSLVSDIFT